MSERFELYRLSLLPNINGDLFEAGEDKVTREQWLRRVFGQEQPFVNRNSIFHYVPAAQDSAADPIIGRIGRKIIREENKPPSEGLVDVTHEGWIAAVLVLDPTHHGDAQKLAFQVDDAVGRPLTLVRKLVLAINERYPYGPYEIQVAQITEEQSFWHFIKENEGSVTSVTFDFIAPNMFGSDDEFSNEMRDFRYNEAARKVNLTLQNESGLKPDTPRMRRAVHYASRGGGKIRARAKGGKHFNSRASVKRSYLEDVRETGTELIRVARRFVNKILGRE